LRLWRQSKASALKSSFSKRDPPTKAPQLVEQPKGSQALKILTL